MGSHFGAVNAVAGQKMPWHGQAFYMPPAAQYTVLDRGDLVDFITEGGGIVVEDAGAADIVLLGAADAIPAAQGPRPRAMREGELIDVAREAVKSWIARFAAHEH
jgi:hypothetical protein